ncbi:hypothetical protein FUA23_07625 [Neolewinella aurantiaca]|uniref:Secreted protein n=1 Tax=Neolewinella aurantiaca TaxID=2602767 RepID=A0A5C7FHX7_9BACT|nr:hypothetical protein [Neolewinella aurantiaca]TXF90101.1 hypothetical protein FUA23_07625 [Neolewinella aurantiaca]
MRFVKQFLLAAPLVFFTAYLNSAASCECGTHSGGITAYTVSGTGCCSGDVIYRNQSGLGLYRLLSRRLAALLKTLPGSGQARLSAPYQPPR